MTKRETQRQTDESSTPDEPKPALQQQSIRVSDEDWAALEAIAKAERRQTGSNITVTGLVRRILSQEIRRRTGSKPTTIVIS
jgi:hypothetical protein